MNDQAFTKLDFLKTRFLYKMLILGVFIVLLSLFYTWTRIQAKQLVYEINELKEEQTQIKVTNRQLQMELSLLKSPKTIDKIAKQKLNMQSLDQSKILSIKNDSEKYK